MVGKAGLPSLRFQVREGLRAYRKADYIIELFSADDG